jgi:uncharacterized surface protein with fasciclin (FAS1) repeats
MQKRKLFTPPTMLLRRLVLACTAAAVASQSSIFQTAASVPTLSTLTSLVNLAGLATTLNTTGSTNYTVLAPTNTAFAALPSALVDWLTNAKATNRAALTSTLLYHVLGAAVPSSAVPAAPGIRFFPTLCGAGCTPVLNATNSSNAIVLRNALASVATVAIPNVVCSNGIVHVVDSVLLPNNTAGVPTLDVVQTAIATPALSNLTAALVATSLTTALTIGPTSSSFTVFAPVNAAFAAVPASISGNLTLLSSVLLYHVVVGRIYAENLPAGVAVNLTTLNGQNLTVTRNGAIVTVRGAGSIATVTAADIDSTK